MMLAPVRLAWFCALSALLAGCGGSERPVFQPLARAARGWQRSGTPPVSLGGRPVRTLELSGASGAWGLELSVDFARTAWEQRFGAWSPKWTPVSTGRSPDATEELRITTPERELEPFRRTTRRIRSLPTPGQFLLLRSGDVLVRLEEGEEPEDGWELATFVERERVEGRTLRVRGRRFSGEGLVLLPGERSACRLELAPESALSFRLAVEPLWSGVGPALEPVRVRVELDGELVGERELAVGPEGAQAFVRFALPPAARADAELAIALSGPLVWSAVLAPVLGPAAIGTYGQRPWGAGRPDLVWFLADTFRADNLSLYRGPGDTDPRAEAEHLEALFRGGLRFRNSWSTSTSTLPSHAALFAGIYPRQAGIAGHARGLAQSLDTIAEHLARFGYRTVAITDSVVLSNQFDLDQGFGFFDERNGNVADTVERARRTLADDDGRPLFLYVQTYATHLPYTISSATRARHGAQLGLPEADFPTLWSAFQELEPQTRDARLPAFLRNMRAYYQAAVLELDGAFAEFRAELEARDLLECGALLFTSDHGESFHEHRQMFHGGVVYEEQVRVPFGLFGRGLPTRVVNHPVSSIDVPPTLAALAGVPPAQGWVGRSVLELRRTRPVYLFQAAAPAAGSSWAVVENGTHKALLNEPTPTRSDAPFFLGAFDLASDPDEALDQQSEAWARRLYERGRRAYPPLVVPRIQLRAAALSARKQAELEAMGYAGEE